MKDVSVVDTSSTILNIPVSLPLFICPTGVAKLINPEAEKGLARGAKSTGILEIVSFGISKQIPLVLISHRFLLRQAIQLRRLSNRLLVFHFYFSCI